MTAGFLVMAVACVNLALGFGLARVVGRGPRRGQDLDRALAARCAGLRHGWQTRWSGTRGPGPRRP